MCGIAGYVGKSKISADTINDTLALMKRRGPDAEGYEQTDYESVQVLLLHTRLSIIDLDARSSQPFKIGPYTIVFNGEIYNYLEIRRKLECRGVSFRTNSDTEVLLQSFIMDGPDCVQQFEGMWAFAILDKTAGRLFLSRDRFGEKPLYYMRLGQDFYFASEIKCLRRMSGSKLAVNGQQISRYLVNGYKSLYKHCQTFYSDVYELEQGHNLEIDLGNEIKKWCYWEPRYEETPMDRNEAVEMFKSALFESVRLRLRSDVPLAFCLSGGIDSSALVSIAAKEFGYDIATFSIIDSDERYNEYENVMATVNDLGCRNTIIHVGRAGFFDRLRQQIDYHDGPVSTISYYIHSFLSEAIAGNGFKVAISGTGADELVTGYYDHFNMYLYEMRNHPNYQSFLTDWHDHTGRVVRNPFLQKPEVFFDNPGLREHIYLNNDIFASMLTNAFWEAFDECRFCDSLLRNRMLNELFYEAVPPILHEDDLNSMYYSLENRSPYLDNRLFQLAYSIPTEYLIQSGYSKSILRDSVKGILNEKVRTDRQKKGFNASIQSIVDFNDPVTKDYLLDESPIFDIVRREKVEEALKMNEMPNSFSKFVFNFINAKMFLEIADRT